MVCRGKEDVVLFPLASQVGYRKGSQALGCTPPPHMCIGALAVVELGRALALSHYVRKEHEERTDSALRFASVLLL